MSEDRRSEYATTEQRQMSSRMQRRDMQVNVYGETVTLTPSDLMLAKQCAHECFMGRILPMTLASCGGLYFLGKSGYIRSNYFKYFGAFMGSFIFGKLTFTGRCEEIIANSNSNTPFVEAVRKKRNAGAGSLSGQYVEQPYTNSWKSSDGDSFGFRADRGSKNKWGDVGFSKDGEIGFVKEEAEFDIKSNVNDPFNEGSQRTEDETWSRTDNQPKYTNYDELRQKNRSSFKY